MRKNKLHLLFASITVFSLFNISNTIAQDRLLAGEFPNGTTNISGEITDPVSGYKLVYYNMKYLQDVDNKSYYQFNSGMGSYVKIEAPSGEYFQQGDEIRIDTYVNRGNGDNRNISLYDRADYSATNLVGSVSASGGYITGVYSIILGTTLPENTNILYMPATSSINSYINIHSVEVYGERGAKAKLATLAIGTASLDGYKVNYSVAATSSESDATLSYTKEVGKDVVLAISDVQTTNLNDPGQLTSWNTIIPASLPIPAMPGQSNYYYLRSSLADNETVYYELKITRRNTEDVLYNYDLTVNPITSVEDPGFNNIISNTGNFHSQHGWRFNYIASADETIQLKVEGDAIIKLRGSVYNSKTSKITATVANPTSGNIVTPDYQVTAVKDNKFNNFYYAGGANTITFTYSGADAGFLTYITIINEGSGEANLRAIFVGNTELSTNDFDNNEYTLDNVGYVSDPTAGNAFPAIAFAMKYGEPTPNVSGLLDAGSQLYTYTFEFAGNTYKVHIPYEAELGYAENAAGQRYDISTAYGLKTVTDMLNTGAAVYKTVYLPDGTYDLGDIDGSYQHGISLTAENVVMTGESINARITGKYRGVTSSVVEVKGANTIFRNLTIENLVGDNGVAPALSTGADNILFDKVQIIGWQDTYVGGDGRHLFNECIIAGSVDFICNGSAVDYFLRCELQLQYRNNGGYISAPQGETYFYNCRVTNAPGNATSMNNKFALARPWRTTGKVFFVNTEFDIVAGTGFTTMSSNVFPVGSCGSAGNIKEADRTLLNFNNDSSTPEYIMTEQEISTYSSVYKMCGATLADLVSKPVTIPEYSYTTLYSADALVVPTGVTAYAVLNINNNHAELGELYTAGDEIPALTPVVLGSQASVATTFFFTYAEDKANAQSANLLAGSLVHQSLSDANLNFYTLGNTDNVVAFINQGNQHQGVANTSYLLLDGSIASTLPLSGSTGIFDTVADKTTDGDGCMYDLRGYKITQPKKGQVYIINGSKRIQLK